MFLLLLLLIVLLVLLYKYIYILEPFEKKNKCAFFIPIQPPHFDSGYKILEKLQNTDADLYFIFSTEKDKNDFEINKPNNYNYLILSEFTDLDRLYKNNSWTSVKKLYALSKLYTNYDYISCIDADITFINTTNFYNIMKNIATNNKIIGGIIDNETNNNLKTSLTHHIPYEDIDKLKKISKDYTIFTWWSNLPVYDCKKAKEFLEYIQFNNTTFIDKIVWSVFDDLMYNYYLILKYNFQLVVIPGLKFSLETADDNTVKYVDQNICKLYWVNFSAYKTDNEYYKNNNFIIVYHLDR